MRNAFAKEITSLAQNDSRIVLLSGDIGNKLFDDFKNKAPKRFYNCGVAEANMMGVAAGMALSGLRPIIYTITPFTTTRCFEQIRVDVCYHQAPVIIVGTGAGLSYAELGPTHHSLEDLAILRTLPGMTVAAPCDAVELKYTLQKALTQNNPVYIRIGKKGEPIIHDNLTDFQLGKAILISDAADVLMLSTGTIISEALEAKEILKNYGISAGIASFPFIKPLDVAFLNWAADKFRLLISIEEHGLIGGFGSAIAEWNIHRDHPTSILNIGTPDEFMHETGSQAYARQKYGLVAKNIAEKILQKLKRQALQ
ncbi:MAG TPA: transketolase C-terminal domain-containing protein [Gammaproteobacteria bacterium]|jgi:transketolase|nr:transketolase C-terminal domain-containing protein [Gammaproteobacteria bacterium]